MLRVIDSKANNVQKQLLCLHGLFLSYFWAEFVKRIIWMSIILEIKYHFQYYFAFDNVPWEFILCV